MAIFYIDELTKICYIVNVNKRGNNMNEFWSIYGDGILITIFSISFLTFFLLEIRDFHRKNREFNNKLKRL